MLGKVCRLLFVLPAFFLLAYDARAEPVEPEQLLSKQLRLVMSKCWGSVADLPEPQRLAVTLRIDLDKTGQLMGDPVIVRPVEIAEYDEAMRTALARAVRAVKKCAPYDELPVEHYEVWKRMTLHFRHDQPLAIPLG